MTRRVLALCVLTTVILAGCIGAPTDPGTDATPTPDPDGDGTSVSADEVPGVESNALTNATALVAANEAAIGQSGGQIAVVRGQGDERGTYQLTAGSGFSTYNLTQEYTTGDGLTPRVDLWSNETTRYIRMMEGTETSYRVLEREQTRLDLLGAVEEFVAGGDYTVQNESGPDGALVLTAESYTQPTDARSAFSDVSSYEGQIVAGESGLIQNVSVEAVDDGRSMTYRYELVRSGIEGVPQPQWLADVPESARFHPDIEITPTSSALSIRHVGGDPIPANSAIRIESNGTTSVASFDSELDGETRYAYRNASDGALRIAEDEPTAENVEPIQSPVSVTITTDDGVTLYSASMGWDSETAAEGSSGSDSQSASS